MTTTKRKPKPTAPEKRAARIRARPKVAGISGFLATAKQLEDEREAGMREGIQKYANLLERRANDHLDRADEKFIFKGNDNIRADECREIRRIIMDAEKNDNEKNDNEKNEGEGKDEHSHGEDSQGGNAAPTSNPSTPGDGDDGTEPGITPGGPK